jgi:hypothetical protein
MTMLLLLLPAVAVTSHFVNALPCSLQTRLLLLHAYNHAAAAAAVSPSLPCKPSSKTAALQPSMKTAAAAAAAVCLQQCCVLLLPCLTFGDPAAFQPSMKTAADSGDVQATQSNAPACSSPGSWSLQAAAAAVKATCYVGHRF